MHQIYRQLDSGSVIGRRRGRSGPFDYKPPGLVWLCLARRDVIVDCVILRYVNKSDFVRDSSCTAAYCNSEYYLCAVVAGGSIRVRSCIVNLKSTGGISDSGSYLRGLCGG